MKKFQFRFKTVEKVRSVREKQALSDLARAQQALILEENRKTEIESKIDSAHAMKESLSNEPVGSREYHLADSYIMGLKQQRIRAEQGIRKARRMLEKLMVRAVAARRELRMIETLKTHDQQEFKKELNLHEQKQYDDLSTMRNRFVKAGENE